MFSVESRPLWVSDSCFLNDSKCCSLKKVEDMISKGDISAANQAAENIPFYYDKVEAYKKITEYHLKDGDLSKAFAASREIDIMSIQDECLKKIAQGYLDRNDLVNAKAVLGHTNLSSSRREIGFKLMDLELNKGDLVSSVRTCSLIGSQDAAQKLADKILDSKPDLKTIYQIEENASKHLWSFPTLHKMILNALLALCKTLGIQDQVDRLENKINNFFGEDRALSLLAGLYTCYAAGSLDASLPVSLGVGTATTLATTLAIRYPAARRIENLLGVGVGMAATAAGVTALPAVGMGLGTTFFARIPLVQAAPLAVFRAGSKVFKQAVTELPNFAYRLVEGIGTGVWNASEALISGAGKAISAADFVLDKWTLRK